MDAVQRYADTSTLAAQYDSMRGWADHVASLAGDAHLRHSGFRFGDWLDPTAPAGRPEAAATPGELVATAYFARSAEVPVRSEFRREYVTATGRMTSGAPTAYALALCFDLLESDEQRAHAGTRLSQLVRADGHKIATGFVGTALICDALTRSGHTDTAHRLLLQQERAPVLAPPRHHGCDHHLGALGARAPGRHRQPERDDLIHLLRARRRR
ncbi:hypothetical protein [Streptomyces sp. NPDC056683]|uniref:alpha-L-rhamnosidase-related protein n=1 Tax=Streptomyces sp. NPDC056683 TaxID=3345910 RepID=UPI00368F5BBA